MRKATAILLSFLLVVMQASPAGFALTAYAFASDQEASQAAVQAEDNDADESAESEAAEGAVDEELALESESTEADGDAADETEQSEDGASAEETQDPEVAEVDAQAAEGADESGAAVVEGDGQEATDGEGTGVTVVSADGEDAAETEADAEKEEKDAEKAENQPLIAEYEAMDGTAYVVEVAYDEAAGIPEDATLRVNEIGEGTADYEALVSDANEELRADGQVVDQARFFDIAIMSGKKEVHPSADVQVKIQLADGKKLADAHLLHYEENKAGEVQQIVEIEASTTKNTLEFDTDGFSIYGVVYTVDFSYDVDGTSYEYSITGGTVAPVADILRAVGVLDGVDQERFMADVADVTFSNDELAWVGMLDADTTAGDLLDSLGAEPEYSAELSGEQISDMRSTAIPAGEWVFASLKPFESQESLTITMATGETFIVSVLDELSAGDTNAVFEVKKGTNTTYWSTFDEAIAKTNENPTATTITILSGGDAESYVINEGNEITCTGNVTINGNGNTLVRGSNATGDLISKVRNGVLTINDLTLDGGDTAATGSFIARDANYYIYDTVLSNVTINAGNTTGSVVSIGESAVNYSTVVTMSDCTINMEQSSGSAFAIQRPGTISFSNVNITGCSGATDSLVKLGSSTASLDGVTISGFEGASSGIYAVDASSATLTLSGATNILGNTAGGENANVLLSSDAADAKIGALTGKVGISSSNNSIADNFAYLLNYTDESGLANLVNDDNGRLSAVRSSSTSTSYRSMVYWSIEGVLDSSKFYIVGNLAFVSNKTLYFDTLEEAVAASSKYSGDVTIYSMVSEYTINDSVTITKNTTICPGKDASGTQLSSLTLKRGDESRVLIWNTDGTLTLNSVVLDGQNKVVNGALLRLSGGSDGLTLKDVTAKNHHGSSDSVYAIDASDCTSKVYVSGNVTIDGNVANVSSETTTPANLAVVGTSILTVSGNLTGTLGVSNTLHKLAGEQFGILSSSSYSIGTMYNDFNTNIKAEKSSSALVWKSTSSTSDYVVKITDANGKLLYDNYANSSNNYALYTSYNDIVGAINNNRFYSSQGTLYDGAINVELLKDYVETTSAADGIHIKKERNITFKTASSTSPDNEYPYTGSGTMGMVRFMNGGGAGNTNNRYFFEGDGSTIVFENIVVDGRGDQGIMADEGALITVGDRGGDKHTVTCILGEGCILQNGSTNAHDQGGGVYVGSGCTLEMNPGSIIQYCKSNRDSGSSGGAIYLADSTFYCDGGIIRNCVCTLGGAVDLGGTTDGAQSDKARIYLSGSPQIIDNYDNSGNPCNVHLNYDSNEIINVIGDLDSSAQIGVYADDAGEVYNKHGKETMPFATIAKDITPQNLDAFVNDRDTNLTGEQSTTDSSLVVWFYRLNVSAVDDYMIDGSLIRTTELSGSEGVFRAPTTLPTSYTDAEIESAYKGEYEYALYKHSEYSRLTLEKYGDSGAVRTGVTNLRCITSGYGKQWQYSSDGSNWAPISGRDLTIHYTRECRDNIKVVKGEDTNMSDLLKDVQFKLERKADSSGSYSLYANGAGKGMTTSHGVTVGDASENGIYTTDADGAFVMNLPEGYYRLTEVEAAEGYEKLAEPITFKVSVSMVPDTTENEEVSPYAVSDVSSLAAYEGKSYKDWSAEKIFGTMTVGNVRQIPTHVLVRSAAGAYELADTMRTTAYTTAGISEGQKNVTNLNPIPAAHSEYEIVRVYYGSQNADGSFNLETAEEVSTLTGTTSGIVVNGNAEKKIAKTQALYYIYEKPYSQVTISKTVSGAMGDTSESFSFTLNVSGASTSDTFNTERDGESGTIRNGGSFSLKHGQSLQISLPQDVVITLVEVGADGYTQTWNLSNATAATQADGTEDLVANGKKFIINAKKASVALDNYRGTIAPTEASSNLMVYGVILAFGVVLIAYNYYRRRRFE